MNEKFKNYLDKTKEIGRIVAINQSIAWVSGLPGLSLNEMVICQERQKGIVFGLNKDTAEILMLDSQGLKTNQAVTRTNQNFQIAASKGLLGRIIDPLCRPLDNLGPILGEKQYRDLDNPAPNLTERVRIKQPLETGILKVDLLIPLGYGQRELILGDKKTGKTTFLLQTFVSQAKRGTIGIYVAVGKRMSDLKMVENYLREKEVFDKMVMVNTTAADPAPIIYLAPYAGMSIAEFFRDQGYNVLIAFDDLTFHAKIYREIALLLKRFPGRGSYPGDIFHIHAKLLERAGNILKNGQEISITALPVADTLENDITGYIQTNLMAITDGHIFFDVDEFRKGARPAISVFLSVSRVGNQTKTPLEREIAEIVRKKMSSYKKALEIARFGVELPKQTKEILDFGKKLEVIFSQETKTILTQEVQLLLLGLLLANYWREKSVEKVAIEVKNIIASLEQKKLSIKEIKKLKTVNELISFVNRYINNTNV